MRKTFSTMADAAGCLGGVGSCSGYHSIHTGNPCADCRGLLPVHGRCFLAGNGPPCLWTGSASCFSYNGVSLYSFVILGPWYA